MRIDCGLGSDVTTSAQLKAIQNLLITRNVSTWAMNPLKSAGTVVVVSTAAIPPAAGLGCR